MSSRPTELTPRPPARAPSLALALLAAAALSCGGAGDRRSASAAPLWAASGSLGAARAAHTATLLANGKVLVAGGVGGAFGALATAELYDPATGTWSATGDLSAARQFHTATLLRSGKVLVAGGRDASASEGSGTYHAGAELYDPATGTWSATGPLVSRRAYHTATLLPSGKVLVAGGALGASGFVTALQAAELYDPDAGTFTETASPLADARYKHAATLLPSGSVLFTGGVGVSAFLSAAERYDPATDAFSPAGNLADGRYAHTATLLPSGSVLVTGGAAATTVTSAELYDAAGGTWSTTTPPAAARSYHSATLLPSGKVLVAGGLGVTAAAELFDPGAASWSDGGALLAARGNHTATMLPSGDVLLAGGSGDDGAGHTVALASAERHGGHAGAWSATTAAPSAALQPTLTVLPSGEALLAGGSSGSAPLDAAARFDPGAGTWTATTALTTARAAHTATLLASGKVLVAGGAGASAPIASAELYDPAADVWTATGALAAARSEHTATLLPSGKVLVAGGLGASGALATAELYDPASGAWTSAGALSAARSRHTATLLASGKVLVAGGWSGSAALASAELWDPATGAWTATGPLSGARERHRATLLPSGLVLASGGSTGGTTALDTCELYDPAAGSWTTAASLSLAARRLAHDAVLLPSGKVLVAGGSDGAAAVTGAELFDPVAGTWTAAATPATARDRHAAVVLPSGKVLVAGGSDGAAAIAGAELWDDGRRGAGGASAPVLSGSPAWALSGASLSLAGTGFTGGPEGSGGGLQSSPSNVPVVLLQREDGGALVTAGVGPFTATAATAALPAALQPGVHWLRVVVNGIPSAAAALTVCPALVISPASASITPGGSRSFSASGGSGTGYAWSLAPNASGGKITAAGVYTAGSTGSVTDVVQVTDSLGNVATLSIAVGRSTIAPPGATGCSCTTGGGGLPLLALALAALLRRRAR